MDVLPKLESYWVLFAKTSVLVLMTAKVVLSTLFLTLIFEKSLGEFLK